MNSDEAAFTFATAARAALEEFAIVPDSLTLESVSENVTFRVRDAGGSGDYVLRLHRPGYHSLPELESERLWLRALSEARIDVPQPVAARDGRSYVLVPVGGGQARYAGLTRWRDGEPLRALLSRTNDIEALRQSFRDLGRLVARVHNQSSGWQPPASFVRHALDADGLMGETPFWGPFWEHPVLEGDERRLLYATRGRIHAALSRLGHDPATFSMIHADLHPGNVLQTGDGLAVIDFDDAGFGWHHYEIAVALYSYRDVPHFAAVEAAFLEGYRSLRPFAEADRAMLPMFLLVRGLAILGWLLQRPELGRADAAASLKQSLCEWCERFVPPC